MQIPTLSRNGFGETADGRRQTAVDIYARLGSGKDCILPHL